MSQQLIDKAPYFSGLGDNIAPDRRATNSLQRRKPLQKIVKTRHWQPLRLHRILVNVMVCLLTITLAEQG